MPPTRPSTNEVEDVLEMLQALSMFSAHGDKIYSFVLNMESFLFHERIDNLKQIAVTDFFKRRQKKKKASQMHLCQFLLFLSNFLKIQTLNRSNFF